MTATVQAAILVGGRGTRLGAHTAQTPKPLLAMSDDRPFLEHLLDAIARQGLRSILLLAGHMGEQVVALYDGRTVRNATIKVIVEPEAGGTAGALRYAQAELDNAFFLLNGDAFFDVNIRGLEQAGRGFDGSLALRRVPDAGRFGRIDTDADGRIVAFREKSAGGEGDINGGVYWLRKSVLERIVRLPCSLETEVFPALAAEGRLNSFRSDGYFLDIGLPETLEQGRREIADRSRRPALFLDRDGVLNKDHGYVHRPEDFEWQDGAIEAIRRFNDRGWRVFVVTNQAGVARGYYGEAEVTALHRWADERLAEEGAFIDAWYHCPYHADAVSDAFRHPDHPDRKPNPGMILRALSEWPVDRERSFLIGDQETDLEAARRAGIRGFRYEGGSLAEVAESAFAVVAAEPGA